jgi:hypothetical protein
MRTFYTKASNQDGTILHRAFNHSAPIILQKLSGTGLDTPLPWQVETGRHLARFVGDSRTDDEVRTDNQPAG